MVLDLFAAVKELYDYELFDDLLLFVELNLEEHKLSNMFSETEQACIYFYIADAHFQSGNFEQSSKVIYFGRLKRTFFSFMRIH